MVMLTGAFDCSQDPPKKHFIMAGFVSSAEEWARFDERWRERLRADNLPYFHMHAFAQSFSYPKPPFDETWAGNKARREALLSDLLDIIASHAWRKFGSVLPVDMVQLFSDVARNTFMPSLIATAGRLIWSDVETWRRREKFQQPARMVFEDGDGDKGSLISAMKEVTGRSPSFEPKKDNPEKEILAFTPLQASDILAYEIQKITQCGTDALDSVKFRFPIVQLEKLPGDIRILQREGAQLMDEFMRVVLHFKNNPLPPSVQ